MVIGCCAAGTGDVFAATGAGGADDVGVEPAGDGERDTGGPGVCVPVCPGHVQLVGMPKSRTARKTKNTGFCGKGWAVVVLSENPLLNE